MNTEQQVDVEQLRKRISKALGGGAVAALESAVVKCETQDAFIEIYRLLKAQGHEGDYDVEHDVEHMRLRFDDGSPHIYMGGFSNRYGNRHFASTSMSPNIELDDFLKLVNLAHEEIVRRKERAKIED